MADEVTLKTDEARLMSLTAYTALSDVRHDARMAHELQRQLKSCVTELLSAEETIIALNNEVTRLNNCIDYLALVAYFQTEAKQDALTECARLRLRISILETAKNQNEEIEESDVSNTPVMANDTAIHSD